VATDSENPFWDFSLLVYHRLGVAEACLALQDRHGLDVNLLLFCCWAGSQGRRLDAADIERVMASLGDWQNSVVGPLRDVRRRLKDLPGSASGQLGALRQAVKDCELEAERIEQAMLHDALAPSSGASFPAAGQATCAAANLTAYLEVAGPPVDFAGRTNLETLLHGAFDTLSPEATKQLLRQ
jgi:uncharacterized protein (TIGR02444 family)